MRPNFRIGYGYDVHPLVKGRPFWLGGIHIPNDKGGYGHSDADVLTHAICDALLGAANLRDIGFHFPDTDNRYHNISSIILLKEVMKLLTQKGYAVGNIDATVCLQHPKINQYIPSMAAVLSKALDILPTDISIKATTTEKLGFVGKEEGVTAHAISLIYQVHDK